MTLNPPGLTFDLSQPDGTNDSIAAGEVLTVQISAAHLSNANLSNANLSNAHLSNANLSNANLSNANLSNANLSNSTTAAAHLSNANLSNANLSNANLSNANLSNANLSNANLSNANLSNANLSNASVTDIDYTVTNTGNTTQAFDVRLLATAATNPVQLIVSRTYTKPIANGCELVEQPDNKLVVNAGIVDPADPASVASQNPLATFPLAPGETIQVTLRSFSTIAEARTLATTVAPVVTAQGNPASTSVALVVQNDAALPAAKVNVPYALPLQAIGGTGTLTWGLATGSVLPPGLQIVGSQIAGAPSSAGSFAFTLELTDEATPVNLTQKDVTLVIQKGASAATLTPSSTSPVFGETVTLTVALSPSSGPTGSVTFLEGATSLGSAPIVSGVASLVVPATLAIGAHSFTASYPGDGNWEAIGATTSPVTVGPASTGVALASGGGTTYGQQATFTAQVQVQSPGSGTPSGQVEFREGATVLGTATLSGGTATFTTSALAGGSHAVVAAYLGDGNFAAAQSSAVTQTVTKVSTSVAVAIDPGSLVFGASVPIVATVGPVPAGGQGPSGNAYFWDGAMLLGSQALTGGSATFLATGLAAGGARPRRIVRRRRQLRRSHPEGRHRERRQGRGDRGPHEHPQPVHLWRGGLLHRAGDLGGGDSRRDGDVLPRRQHAPGHRIGRRERVRDARHLGRARGNASGQRLLRGRAELRAQGDHHQREPGSERGAGHRDAGLEPEPVHLRSDWSPCRAR